MHLLYAHAMVFKAIRSMDIVERPLLPWVRCEHAAIDDYAKDGGKELFTKMHCVLITNP